MHDLSAADIPSSIPEDKIWQDRWTTLVNLPTQRYDLPSGAVGRRFIKMLTTEMAGIKARKWNSERMIVFTIVMLQRERDVIKRRDIIKRITKRMDLWEAKKHSTLINDTLRSNLTLQKPRKKSNEPADHTEKVFARLLLQGKLRQAVRWVTGREKGGVLHPTDIDAKTGKPVAEVLESKHPVPMDTKSEDLQGFETVPEMLDIEITEETVFAVAKTMQGGAGPGGTDATAWQNWMLRYGGASTQLRQCIGDLATWMSNGIQEGDACRAIMANRLIALDKCPGVRPVGIGEILRRILAKCVLRICGGDVKDVCGEEQLASGLEAGIEGGVHAMNELWKTHADEDDWGLLLVDAANAFNAISRRVVLWNVRHLWPRGARFVFNCYCYWAALILTGFGVLFSQEGVTQGDPLSMVIYSLAVLPLIQHLATHPNHQMWYADDSSNAGSFDGIEEWYLDLAAEGPKIGYQPEPTKSILVVSEKNFSKAERKFNYLGFEVTTGARYLGGYVGNNTSKNRYIEDKVNDWCESIKIFASMAPSIPQLVYAAVSKSLQHEWSYLQRVTEDCCLHFKPLEELIQNTFLPSLFGIDLTKYPHIRTLTALPVKQGGISIPNPKEMAEVNYHTSKSCTSHLSDSLLGCHPFNYNTHRETARNKKKDMLEEKEMFSRLRFDQATHKDVMDPDVARGISRTTMPGSGNWLSFIPTISNENLIAPLEFRDALCKRYLLPIVKPPTACDGCQQPFTLNHALNCPIGGLTIRRHNEIRDELAYLAAMAYGPSAVRLEPFILNEREMVPITSIPPTTTIPPGYPPPGKPKPQRIVV